MPHHAWARLNMLYVLYEVGVSWQGREHISVTLLQPGNICTLGQWERTQRSGAKLEEFGTSETSSSLRHHCHQGNRLRLSPGFEEVELVNLCCPSPVITHNLIVISSTRCVITKGPCHVLSKLELGDGSNTSTLSPGANGLNQPPPFLPYFLHCFHTSPCHFLSLKMSFLIPPHLFLYLP